MRLVADIRSALTRHPLRTVLMLLTFALGAASVIVTLATVEGGRRSIIHDLEGIGVDVIVALNPVQVGPISLGSTQAGDGPPKVRLDLPRIDELERRLRAEQLSVEDVMPFTMDLVAISNSAGGWTTTSMATDHRFTKILKSGLIAGRFLEPGDEKLDPMPVVFDEAFARKVCAALRKSTDTEPVDPADALGLEFSFVRKLEQHQVKVVGVMNDPISLRRHLDALDANKRARTVGARRLQFENIYAPFDRATSSPSGTFVRVADLDQLDRVGERISEYIEECNAASFLFVQKQWIDHILAIVNTFTALANFIWIIDLLIVIILVATISLMAIEERYHEIAIRRTEGARVSQVVAPLLVEGALLALLSCPLGWLLAQLILHYQVEPVLLWEPYLPFFAYWGLPLALVFTGVGSNLLTARRIARLNPAEVLSRYEG